MSRLYTAGAEIAADGITNAPDGAAGGTVTRDTTTFRSGVAAYKYAGTAAAMAFSQWSWTAEAAGTGFYARAYLFVPSLPTTDTDVVEFLDVGNAVLVRAKLLTNGTVSLNNQAGAIIGSASSVLTLNQWYRVELFLNIGTGSVDSAELRVDGVSIASGSSLSISDNVPTSVRVGLCQIPGNTTTLYADDIALNDTGGATQNSWPGEGKVVLLTPISDSAVGAGWTLGTGTAIAGNSGSTAVKNTPPQGVADLAAGSDTKQIRNATSNANSSYDANLTSYTTAGIGSSDTVNLVVPLVATAAPVVTSAKAGTVGVVSNPTIANVSLAAQGTSGAFWSGFAAGTYTSGWKWTQGTVAYAPSVTRGTSPVARITQVTSSTRIADVCFLGMYVDYTPATPKSLVYADRRVARNSLLRR